jgi:tetratricopeptide (TPR) repeat protein
MKIILIILLAPCLILPLSCREDRVGIQEVIIEANENAMGNNFDAALKLLETKIKVGEREYLYYLYHGLYTYSKNPLRYAELALRDYQMAYKYNSETYELNDIMGSAYLVQKNYQEALFYCDRAIKLYNKNMEGTLPPYWGLAESYLKTGEIEKAIEVNKMALDIDPNFSWSYMQKGIILSQNGDIDVLKENYLRAIEIDPYDFSLYREYGLRLIELGHDDVALNVYIEWANENANYNWCFADLGYIYMLQKNFGESIKYLKRAEELINTDELTLKYLSFYYFFRNEYQKSFEYDARKRLLRSADGRVYNFQIPNEYFDNYSDDWQFQRLLKIYGQEFL